ncbi:MAG: ribosomal protein uS13 [Candidatus Comchoanobacterales bacterium]
MSETVNYIIANRVLNKKGHVWFELTKIYGIGKSLALKICAQAVVNPHSILGERSAEDLDRLRNIISTGGYTVEGDLRKFNKMSILRLVQIGCYRGLRHRRGGVPVRGQRTGQSNGRTAKRLNNKVASN